jgi:methylenetetrahydrofolate reductase (NADPH)
MFEFPYIIELLSPKKSAGADLQRLLDRFAERYTLALDLGCGISVPDNPMGQQRLSLIDCLENCRLQANPEKVVMNLNTFHHKKELDALLDKAAELGIRNLLVVRGDGGPELPRIDAQSIGGKHSVATSVDLISYINSTWPDQFITGAAFNPYKSVGFEMPHFEKKVEAGARFVITQPLICHEPLVDDLRKFNVFVVVEAWMSPNIKLFYKSIGKEEEEYSTPFDPLKNLEELHSAYPDDCAYLALLDFNKDLRSYLPRLSW